MRSEFDFLRTKGEDKSIAYAGEEFTQYFYGREVQLRFPTRSGSPQRWEPRRASDP